MKRNFYKTSHREKVDKIEKKATVPGAFLKEKNSKRRLSIYDDFEEEELDNLDPKVIKHLKSKR